MVNSDTSLRQCLKAANKVDTTRGFDMISCPAELGLCCKVAHCTNMSINKSRVNLFCLNVFWGSINLLYCILYIEQGGRVGLTAIRFCVQSLLSVLSLHVCVGSLPVLWLPLMVQRHYR